jgi:streptogramin lyase
MLVVASCLLFTWNAQTVFAADENKPEAPPPLLKRLQEAPVTEVERIPGPARSAVFNNTLLVPNPDGKTYDILLVYFSKYWGPNEIVIIDTATGKIQNIPQAQAMQWHLSPTVFTEGKLFISTMSEGLKQQINVYDPATDKLTIQAIDMPPELIGETHPLILGTDGMLYAGGTYEGKSQAAVCRIDPKTGETTLYGPLGPSHSPRPCWGYSCGADDTHVYVASGKTPWYLIACNRETGEQKTLITHSVEKGYLNVSQTDDGQGTVAMVREPGKPDLMYWLYRGEMFPLHVDGKATTPPWPGTAPKPVVMPPKPELFTRNATPGADGECEIWVRYAADRKEPTPGTEASPEEEGWKPFRYHVKTYPKTSFRLLELPDGRILGWGAEFGGPFMLDPKSDTATPLAGIGVSPYAFFASPETLYISGYPNSVTYAFDLDKPWKSKQERTLPNGKSTASDDATPNPRSLGHLNKFSGVHKVRNCTVGADGRLYLVGEWMRDGNGGGLAWWDPKTGEQGGFHEGMQDHPFRYVATVGRNIIISTNHAKQANLLVYDTTEGKIVRTIEPIPDIKGAGMIVGVSDTDLVGLTAKDKGFCLYRVNVETGERVYLKEFPDVPVEFRITGEQTEPFDFRLGPDGRIWTFLRYDTLVRIDPADGNIEIVGKLKDGGGRIAFSGNNLYLSSRTIEDLRKIPNCIAPEGPKTEVPK